MSPLDSSSSNEAAGHSWVGPATMLALVGALAWSIAQDSVAGGSPFVWFGLAFFVALRERGARWVPLLFFPAALLFVLWFARAATGVFVPLLLGLLIAYVLDPVVDKLETRMGRGKAIAVLALPTMAGLVLLGLFVIPALIAELRQLVERIPELRSTLLSAYEWTVARMGELGVAIDRESVQNFVVERAEAIGSAARGAGTGVVHGVQGLMDLLGILVITPVFGFYLLRDYDRLREQFLAALGDERGAEASAFLDRVDHSLAGYLRGQFLVGAIIGALFWLGMTLFGMDYALLVGLAAVVLNLVPFVGSVATAILAIGVALLNDPSLASVLKVGGLYLGLNLLESIVLSPRIMGQSMSLHPLAIMLALLLGGHFFGFVGLLLAVPLTAILRETVAAWMPEILQLLPRLSRHREST